ncbi:protein scarlet-like [Zerene cesonia]|uniref:protein scarlet-like n=1 Tax=Zerene cesonia TaxID=33412 RepID=UPI0018E55DDB|nr:protein scarlet-like [Zerene cesonia]
MELNKLNEEIHESDVLIKVNNYAVWTPEEKSWWRRTPNNGAGKTTFLVSVAGKCNLPSSGIITVNNVNVNQMQRGVVEMVPQFDVFMESLTVYEHLVFMTEMKLGSVKKIQNRTILRSLIQELKLKALENNTICTLSGGERRLLSLATSLLSSPLVLVCDEPTTGLDSYNALLVVGVLKKLSKGGKIVICSVHQPSSDLFKEFNSVCLMSEGKLVFHGTQRECKEQFERVNLRCPLNFNPAEFYIRAVSNTSTCVKEIMENNRDSSVFGKQFSYFFNYSRCQRNWFKQVQLMIWRSSLSLKREVKNYIFQLFICTLISSMIIGTCYVGISGTTQRGVQDMRGFLWLMCSEVSFSLSYVALYAFEFDLILFKREVGVYTTSAFYVCRFLTLMPRCLVWPVAYVIIATLAVELPDHILTAVKFAASLIITAIASTAYGLGMGALFTSTGVMGDVMPCADLPLFIMSGAFLRLSSLPIWLYPLKYFSHFYYGMDAISNIYWRQIDSIDCPANSTSTCYENGMSVLVENGYSEDFIFEDYMGFLFVTVVWSLVGFYGLKREEIKGYAY